jgi:FtsH-binding integral membrane protein
MAGYASHVPLSLSDRHRRETRSLFAQTMGLVALTAGLFAIGAYGGRNLGGGAGILAFVASFGCLIAMSFAVKRSAEVTLVLLAGFGLLTGVGTGSTLAYYAAVDPAAVWLAAAATGLFIAGFGAAGYATQRDLTTLTRVALWGLLAVIALGIVLVFVELPAGAWIYSILVLVIFAVLTAADFQRLRRSDGVDSAPLLAASIFLDILNVFLIFLDLFSNAGRS